MLPEDKYSFLFKYFIGLKTRTSESRSSNEETVKNDKFELRTDISQMVLLIPTRNKCGVRRVETEKDALLNLYYKKNSAH
jgi:hypothetical protein